MMLCVKIMEYVILMKCIMKLKRWWKFGGVRLRSKGKGSVKLKGRKLNMRLSRVIIVNMVFNIKIKMI